MRVPTLAVRTVVGVIAGVGVVSCSAEGEGQGKPPDCVAVCEGRQCGDDECGGSCGECVADLTCNADGICVGESATTVTGRISFEYRRARLDSTNAIVLDSVATMPALGMFALVIDAEGQTLGMTQITESDGAFSVPLKQRLAGGEKVLFATMWAPSLESQRILLGVLRPTEGGKPSSMYSAPWVWHATVDSSGDVGDLLIKESQGSGAMFVYLFTVAAFETVLEDLASGNEQAMVSLGVLWAHGVSWSCGACYGPGRKQYNESGTIAFDQSIFIGGEEDGSSAWGYPVILHELGHYVARNYSCDDSPGGAHYAYTPTVARMAWSEGWASFFAVSSMSRWLGEPFPMFWDIQKGSSFWTDYSKASCDGPSCSIPRPIPQDGMAQDLAEEWVSVMLWDLWDGADVAENSDDDGTALGTAVVQQAIGSDRFLNWDRGAEGADFVDFVDAVLCAHPALTQAVSDTVINYLEFPYDGSPGCP